MKTDIVARQESSAQESDSETDKKPLKMRKIKVTTSGPFKTTQKLKNFLFR